MQKYSLLLLFILILRIETEAQVHFKLGPIVGMNSTELSTNIPYSRQTFGSGIAAGAFARLEIGKWYIQPEFMYVSKSSTLTGLNTSSNPSDINFSVSGYDINGLLGYELFKVGELANIRGFLGMGQSTNNTNTFNYEGITLPKVNLASGSTNFIAGVGTDVLRFTVDFRYIRSLTELYNASSYTIATNVFLLSLGIKFF